MRRTFLKRELISGVSNCGAELITGPLYYLEGVLIKASWVFTSSPPRVTSEKLS